MRPTLDREIALHMLNMSAAQILELCHLADLSDREIRSDLSLDYIRGEDDYTSNFTSAFRRNVNCYSKTGIRASSVVLKHAAERQTGCDAAIIIRSDGHAKIAVFEAKWSRFTLKRHPWDYPITDGGFSHYSDQLDRQSRLLPMLAVFEMFYCEAPLGKQASYLQSDGSSCIWHDQAMTFRKARAHPNETWSPGELISMLKGGNHSIGQILQAVCICKMGRPVQIEDSMAIAEELRLPDQILCLDCAETNTKNDSQERPKN